MGPRGPFQFGAHCSLPSLPALTEGKIQSRSPVRHSFAFPFWHEGDIQRAKWRGRETAGDYVAGREGGQFGDGNLFKKGVELTRSRSAAAEGEGEGEGEGGWWRRLCIHWPPTARNWQRRGARRMEWPLAKTPSSNGTAFGSSVRCSLRRHLRRLKELLGRNEGDDDPRRAAAAAANMLA